jgi:importin-5
MRSFASILLRRFLFRSSEGPSNQAPGPTLYDRIPPSTLSTIENHLLHSLLNESSRSVRRASVGTISDLANAAMQRGRQWDDLHAQVFNMARSADIGLRECAFRIFSQSCWVLVIGEKTGEDVVGTLKRGLQDEEGMEVSLASFFDGCCNSQRYI